MVAREKLCGCLHAMEDRALQLEAELAEKAAQQGAEQKASLGELQQIGSDAVELEVADRERLSRLVLTAKVAKVAGRQRQANNGSGRARRNVAQHESVGCGLEVLVAAAAAPRASARA